MLLQPAAVAFDYEVGQHDMVNAFLNALIGIQRFYVHFPEGMGGEKGYLLMLLRALYGLKQSPRLWQKELSKKFVELGLKQCSDEPCLYMNEYLIIFFFVDDIPTLYKRHFEHKFHEFWRNVMQRYEVKALGDIKWFLNMRIIREKEQKAVYLCQDSYIKKVIKRYDLPTLKLPPTPLTTVNMGKFEGKATALQIKLYQGKIGSALYAAITTRPDVAFATSFLSTFMTNPSPTHISAIDRVLLYLYRTRFLAICFKGETADSPVHIASDAAYADHPDKRSTGAYIFKLFGGPIDWTSKKQKTVTTSTAEAGLFALSDAGKQLLWWDRFFKAIEFDAEQGPFSIDCDNCQTVRWRVKDEAIQTRLQHSASTRRHTQSLRQQVQEGQIKVRWVSTENMTADGLTKPLPTAKHEVFVDQLGLTDVQHLIGAPAPYKPTYAHFYPATPVRYIQIAR